MGVERTRRHLSSRGRRSRHQTSPVFGDGTVRRTRLTSMLDGTRILAIHHDPLLTGAALLFESVIEGLAKDHGAIISQTFPKDGPMVARAQKLGPVHVGDSGGHPRQRTFVGRVAGRLGYGTPETPWDLIFAN